MTDRFQSGMPDFPQHWWLSDELYAVGQVRGSYHPLQFVVRLSPELRAELHTGRSGIFAPSELSHTAIMAFSTYFHESIHWWQHIGSTTGLMLSLAYLSQCYGNLPYLRKVLSDFGPRKSPRTFLS